MNQGTRRPYYEDEFIASSEDVSKHMKHVYDKSNQEETGACGNTHWRAAKSSARAKKKLDETGLEVAGCRHAIAQKAVNMYTGEQYGYPHYLHVKFLLPLGIQYMWQDVVCKYWPWAVKQGDRDPAYAEAVTKIKPALSVMHAKAHQWSCQVIWGGRNQEGACGGAGEDMEQFFSYLSRLGSTTKNMSSAGREDTITEHVLFWNRRKASSMAAQLAKRYEKNALFQKATEEELTTQKSLIRSDISDHELGNWQDEIVNKARGAAAENAEDAMKSEIEAVALSIRQRKVAINKIADTSKQRARLRKANEKEKLKLEDLLTQLQELPDGAALSVADAISGNFPWHSNGLSSSSVPLSVKKKLVDLWTLSKRYGEEEGQLRSEMKGVLKYWKKKLGSLEQEKLIISGGAFENEKAVGDGKYTLRPRLSEEEKKGLLSIKNEAIWRIQNHLRQAVILFSNVLQNTPHDLDSSSSESAESSC